MRILFLTSRPPWPIRRGDQVRAARLIAELGARHEVRVATLRPPGFSPCPWPAGIAGMEVRQGWLRSLLGVAVHPAVPLQVGLHWSAPFARTLRRLVREFHPHAAVVVLSRLGEFLPALGGTPTLVDLVDSLELNLANRAARQRMLRPILLWEAGRIGRWEVALSRRAAHVTVVSERDRTAIVAHDQALAERVSVLPVAVPIGEQPPIYAPEREVVLLSGNLGYFPTADGALWFASEVWPLVRDSRPATEWWLAGARPPAAVRRLARLPGVRVLADPADLSAVMHQAAVVVAPLRAGSGTPNKVIEAMAAGVPVVTTADGAAGLDGMVVGEVAVAVDAASFASAVSALLADPQAARRQAIAGWGYAQRCHALPMVAAKLETLLRTIVEDRRPSLES